MIAPRILVTAAAAGLLFCAACSHRATQLQTGSSGTGGGTTSGGSGGTGGATGQTSGGSGTTGVPPVPCAPGAVWQGDVCGLTQCIPSSYAVGCVLPDGITGHCDGDSCLVADLSSDAQNCGAPARVCQSGWQCQLGVCVTTGGTGASCSADGCPAGLSCALTTGYCLPTTCNDQSEGQWCLISSQLGGSCCHGVCVNGYQGDPSNCGGCGITCPIGIPCEIWGCSTDCSTAPVDEDCLDSTNDAGFCCQGHCHTATGDSDNCGTCGNACRLGTTCRNNVCTPIDCQLSGCPAGVDCVYGACIAASCTDVVDNETCVFDAGDTSYQGVCCSGACTSLYLNSSNCGACGQACPQDSFCLGKACQSTLCDGGELYCGLSGGALGICCGGNCLDITDDSNCGACGVVCLSGSSCVEVVSSDQFAGACVCDGGTCPSDCPDGSFSFGGGACLENDCTDRTYGPCIEADGGSGICSACGCTSGCCPADQFICPGGAPCQTNPHYQNIVPECSPRCQDSDAPPCPDGTVCAQDLFGECIPFNCQGRPKGSQCAWGLATFGWCDNGACVTSGQSCDGGLVNGVCLASLVSDDCDGGCAADQLCMSGACWGSSCGSRWTGEPCVNRNGGVSLCCLNAACPDYSSDPDDCGGCGVACAPGQPCIDGRCQGAACAAADQGRYCDLDAGLTQICCGPSCVDVSSDSQNCGNCGLACGSGQRCLDGGCAG